MFLWILTALAAFLTVRWFLRQLSIRDLQSKNVLITGCDSGFGHDLAVSLDRLGVRVFAGCLTEKGETELRKLCSPSLITVHLDVTKEASISEAFAFVEKTLPKDKGLWAVVNNAGIAGSASPVEWLTRKDFESVLAVDLFGVIYTTLAALPLLRRGPAPGRVVNMSSIMGRYTVAPAPYSAAKYGVEGFSECIRRELYHHGISVHLIEPGFFSTGLVDCEMLRRDFNSRYDQLDRPLREYYGREYVDTVVDRSCEALTKIMSSNTGAVVKAYVHAVTARFPKARYVVGWDANILFRILWNLPESVGDFLVTRLLPKPKGRS